MSDDTVNLEVNGVPCKARKGQMIIHVTDASQVYVPRFCYHEKLSIAANCRMCLVEVEKAPKPLPACATPVAEGMKVFTKSPRAVAAQRATMEFLLINHPLDCPICDQGGECELQDLAMGFGRDIARFAERKRVVKDKNLGPLVSTDMTRCIHCTRCVRFGQEVAGIQELGTVGRGEYMEIGTFVERSVDHELSGNIIDLCPVGALNSKPFRFHARAWEMTQHALVSPHDGVGTNLYGHVLRGKLMRVVPRPNEAINETWIADRDRFSYEGIYSEDRLAAPMIRRDGEWQTVDWETALLAASKGLTDVIARHDASALGALASPSSTLEELHLLARLTRGLGSSNLDYRLRQQDFRDQDADPLFPWLGGGIAELEQLDSVLVVGSNLRREVPLIAHRIGKAARRGARVSFLNPERFDYLFPVAAYLSTGSDGLVAGLAAVVAAAAQQTGKSIPHPLQTLVARATPSEEQRALAAQLVNGEKRAVLLGALSMRHPSYAELRQLAAALAQIVDASLGYLPEGANAAGAALAGVLPHRQAGGKTVERPGLDVRAMLESPLKAWLLLGGIEAEADCLAPGAGATLAGAEFVVALTPFAGESILRSAHVLLPISTFAETSGTYVNMAGDWQSFMGAAKPLGESRPGWKVLRVLANMTLGQGGFEYMSSEEVRAELQALLGEVRGDNGYQARQTFNGRKPLSGTLDVGMYQVDALVRRAPALQRTREAAAAASAERD